MNEVKKHTAVITGGASGIGRAAALRLAAAGAKISLVDRNQERLEEAARAVREAGGEAMVFQADISDEAQMEDVMKKTAEAWQQIDSLFANASIVGLVSPIEHFDVKEWAKPIQTNVLGTFITVKAVIPYMKKAGGSIVLTSSVSGSRQFAQKGFTAYSTSKAAIAAFGKMAAMELAQYRIRVNVICPGAIETNIGESLRQSEYIEELDFPIEFPKNAIPLTGKPGRPEDVAGVVAFLVSDDAAHISGTEVDIDGAEHLLKG